MFRRNKMVLMNSKDDRIKVMNERITLTERHFTEMCTNFAICARKLAKLRDAYDDLARSVKTYGDEEQINESLKDSLKTFTVAVTLLGDHMDMQVQRLEAKIVNELASFETVCKATRDNLRSAVVARDKEVQKQRQMMDIKTKFPANTSAADSELVKAKLELNRTNKEIDDAMSDFEKRKIAKLKQILTDFIKISLKYHANGLENLSNNYCEITEIDEMGDLLEFQKFMKSKENEPAIDQKRKLKFQQKLLKSQSMEYLDKDDLSPLQKLKKLSRSAKSLNKSDDEMEKGRNVTDDDDNEDDEEDDDDDEEDDDDDDDEDDDDEDDDEDDDDEQSDNKAENRKKSKRNVGGSSDDESAVEGAVGGIKPNSTNVFGIKQQQKTNLKHPFKTVAAASSMAVKPVKPIRKTIESKKSGNAAGGISKSKTIGASGDAGIGGTDGRRIVTNVKSMPATDGKVEAKKIDCSKTGTTGLLFM